MAHTTLRWISGCSIALGLLLGTGCGKDGDSDDTAGDTTDGGTADGTGTQTMTASQTMTDSQTTNPTAEESGSMSQSETADDVSTFDESGTTDDPMPQPNGAMCPSGDDAECESMHCFTSPLGNICGECEVDADCADTTGGGCSLPNPLSDPPTGSTCNDGSLGGGCMTSEVCMEMLVCAEILNVPGFLVASTCSECTMDGDCTDGQLCSPGYDVANLSGSKTCVDPGSVGDGEGCDFMGSGDEACMSGFCAIADIMNIVQLGVCSGCETDEDCANGEMCNPPTVDTENGLMAGGCVPMK